MKIFNPLRFLMVTIFIIISSNSFSQVQIVLKPGPVEGKDAYVNSYYERLLDTTQSIIAAAWTYGGIEGVGRSFIQFELPELPQSYINFSATLNLYYNPTSNHVGHGGLNACKLERVIENWSESGIAWYDQPAVTEENAVFLPSSDSANQNYTNIDVTQLIQDMYSNPESSFGIRLSLTEEIIWRSMILASSDHINPDLWPSLIIKYDIECTPPVASFKQVNYNNAVQFTASSIEDGEYWWQFGNGFYSDLKDPMFVYSEPGEYNVCLVVTDSCGSDTVCNSIQICENIINGTFTSITDGNFVNFTPELQSDTVELVWDFGDGFFSELQRPKHYYNQSGNYLVCMVAKNFCNQVISCDTISIMPIESGNKSSEVVQLYPNPSTGMISVTNGRIQANFEKIKITNFNGTIVLDQNSSRLSKRENGYFCDFTGLESGIYTIHVVTDIGIFTQKAIIIAK